MQLEYLLWGYISWQWCSFTAKHVRLAQMISCRRSLVPQCPLKATDGLPRKHLSFRTSGLCIMIAEWDRKHAT